MNAVAEPQTHDGSKQEMEGLAFGERVKMNSTRRSLTHKFEISGVVGYIVAGVREDGSLGEIFLHGVGKQGSTIDGFINAWAKTFSYALQYGAPVDKLCDSLAEMRFEPQGSCIGVAEIKEAPSIIAYICRYLLLRFGSPEAAAKYTGQAHV